VLNFVAESGERSRAAVASYVRALLDDPGVTVYDSGRGLFLSALSLYDRRRDKQYSLPDCMSMTLMQMHGITHVLTNDHHFRQEGFTVLSDVP
jgi:predicted nucleic acid-binding protein